MSILHIIFFLFMVVKPEWLKFDIIHLFIPPGHENNRNFFLYLLCYGNVWTETF